MDAKREPIVSVIMPAYNVANYIGEAIESILQQTFTDFELLIIDDGSVDNTLDIIKGYLLLDSRIRIIENVSNKGLPYTENLGLKEAKGEYIAIMHSDDIALPDRLEAQVAFFKIHGDVSILGTQMQYLGTEYCTSYPTFHNDIKVMLLEGNCFGHPTIMMRRADIERDKLIYNEGEYALAEDFKMWLDAVVCGLKTANLQNVHLKYRLHENQITSQKRDAILEVDRKLRLEYLNTFARGRLTENEIQLILNKYENSSLIEQLKIFYQIKQINETTAFFEVNSLNKYYQIRIKPFLSKKILCEIMMNKEISLKMKFYIFSNYISKVFKALSNSDH